MNGVSATVPCRCAPESAPSPPKFGVSRALTLLSSMVASTCPDSSRNFLSASIEMTNEPVTVAPGGLIWIPFSGTVSEPVSLLLASVAKAMVPLK